MTGDYRPKLKSQGGNPENIRPGPHAPIDTSAIPGDLCPIATEYNTMLPGDWRAVRPVVDRDKCVKCATCWIYCPVQCVVEKPRWFDIDYRICKGCGICAYECPHHAIAMIDEGSAQSGGQAA